MLHSESSASSELRPEGGADGGGEVTKKNPFLGSIPWHGRDNRVHNLREIAAGRQLPRRGAGLSNLLICRLVRRVQPGVYVPTETGWGFLDRWDPANPVHEEDIAMLDRLGIRDVVCPNQVETASRYNRARLWRLIRKGYLRMEGKGVMRMWMVPPAGLCRKHLMGEHVELHMLQSALRSERMHPSIRGLLREGFLSPQNMVERHEAIAAEMTRRGLKHQSPLSPDPVPAWAHGVVDPMRSFRDLHARCHQCSRALSLQ